MGMQACGRAALTCLYPAHPTYMRPTQKSAHRVHSGHPCTLLWPLPFVLQSSARGRGNVVLQLCLHREWERRHLLVDECPALSTGGARGQISF